jgi:hypothetical protein
MRQQGPYSDEQSIILQLTAAKAAGRYNRVFQNKLSPCAFSEDVRQEALAAAFSCVGPTRWDHARGTPLGGYAWKACINHLHEYVWKNSTPVSVNQHHLKEVSTIRSFSLDGKTFDREDDSHDVSRRGEFLHLSLQSEATAEEALSEEERRSDIAAEMEKVFAKCGEHEAVIARRVLLNEEQPKDVATALGIDVVSVYRVACKARRLLGESKKLKAFWKNA